jgi:thiol-disulfide isomerase/thioredoxin
MPAIFLIVSGREKQGLDLLNSSNDFSEGNFMQIIIGLAVVALLAAAVYFLKKISEQQTQIMRRIEILELTTSEGGGKQIEREEVEHPENGLLIGAPAPDFVLPDLDGKNVSFEHLLMKNKPMLFFFVSPTCAPCAALLPEIETWQNELKGKVDFVFLSSGKAKDNAEKFGGATFKQVLLQKDKEVAELFSAQWTPTAWLVNPDGTIASRTAAGDAAIRDLVERIKAEIDEKDILYIPNGNGFKAPLMGKPLPEFSLEDASGKPVSAEDLRGKKTLVTFWSLGCGFCSQMLDELREWDKTRGQDSPDLLLLSSGNREENLDLGLRGTVLLDDKRDVSKQLGMDGTPSACLVNEEGRVVSEIALGAEQIWKLVGKK